MSDRWLLTVEITRSGSPPKLANVVSDDHPAAWLAAERKHVLDRIVLVYAVRLPEDFPMADLEWLV